MGERSCRPRCGCERAHRRGIRRTKLVVGLRHLVLGTNGLAALPLGGCLHCSCGVCGLARVGACRPYVLGRCHSGDLVGQRLLRVRSCGLCVWLEAWWLVSSSCERASVGGWWAEMVGGGLRTGVRAPCRTRCGVVDFEGGRLVFGLFRGPICFERQAGVWLLGWGASTFQPRMSWPYAWWRWGVRRSGRGW